MPNLYNKSYNNKFSEILTGSVWSFLAQISAAGLGMINSIIIARFYGAELLGVVAIIISFFELTTILTVLGTNSSILRMIPEHTVRYSTTSAFQIYKKTQFFIIIFSIVIGFCIFSFSDLIAEAIFFKKKLSLIFSIASFFIIFNSLVQFNTQAARGLRLNKLFAFMQLLPFITKLTILIIITLFFFDQYNPVYALFSSIAITAFLGMILIVINFKNQLNSRHTIHEVPIQNIIRLSFPMLVSATMYFVIGQTGTLMLGIYKSEADVGYYSVAVRLALFTTYFLKATSSVSAPIFSGLYHSGRIDDLFFLAKRSTKLILWASAPILIFFLIFGSYILNYIYGKEFTASYPILMILLLGSFLSMLSGPNGLFMDMTGNQIVLRNIMIGSATINIILSLLLIPPFGIYGAASSTTISIIFQNIAILFYMKSKYGQTTGYFPFL